MISMDFVPSRERAPHAGAMRGASGPGPYSRGMRSIGIFGWVIALGLGIATASSAERINGVEFADEVTVAGETLPLRGAGLLVYRWVFDAYVSALYLPSDVASTQVLSDVPKRLEIEYFWAIAAEDFGPAADTILRRQYDEETLAPLRDRIEEMSAAYRDVEPGDRYAIEYVPGRGTTLSWNGEEIVNVPGADFAAVYFAVWLGSDPVDAGLKRELLEKK